MSKHCDTADDDLGGCREHLAGWRNAVSEMKAIMVKARLDALKAKAAGREPSPVMQAAGRRTKTA